MARRPIEKHNVDMIPAPNVPSGPVEAGSDEVRRLPLDDVPSVLIAEDHTLVREGLRLLLSPECRVLDAVSDGRLLLEAAERLQPDIILIDIAMPGLNGLEAARQLGGLCPESRLVFVTSRVERSYVREAFAAGAVGYVTKSSASRELLSAIRVVIAGRRYLSPGLSLTLEDVLDEAPAPDPLTTRQREVLQLVAEGRTARQIAEALHISRKTAEFHKSRLMQVLRLHSTAELTRYALEHGVAGS
ncbi:MAG TPA: response regulator transcription factor [Nannocystis sp.]